MWTVTTACSQIAWTLFIALGVKIVWWHWKNRKILALARRFQYGNRALPLIEPSYLIFKGFSNVSITSFVLQKVKEGVENSVKTAVIWLGPFPIISISDPKDIQILLNSGKTIDEAEEHGLLRLIFGNGLLSAPGHVWKVTRRHLSPLFHPLNLNQLMPLMNECGRDLTSILSGHVGPVDVSSPVLAVALKSVHHLVFGLEDKIDVQSIEFRGLLKTMDCAVDVLSHRLYNYWALNDFLFRYIFKKEIKSIESGWKTYLEDATQRAKKRSIQRRMSDDKGSVDEVSKDQPERDETSHLTLVEAYQRLRSLHPEFTEKDLEYEIITFLVTGSDTTKGTLSSCFLALAAYPEVQEKLYAEIVSAVGTEDTDVTVRDLRVMTYLDQVIKETLRKFFLVSSVTRKVSEDLKISECTLPAGTTAIIILHAIHYNSKIFPDPDKFDPERFTPENVAQREKYSFIGFSGGPRNCIGKNYAMNAMKTWIVHVVRRYKLSTQVNIDNIKYKTGFVASCEAGYAIQFERR